MMKGLEPYKPTAEHPWRWRLAAHLLRRAAFAASHDQIADALERGPEATVDTLLSDEPDAEVHDELDALGERLAARNDIDLLRAWWLRRMCLTRFPLRARIALFWHNHFATGNSKVQSARLMLGQLRTFEEHGRGHFETLLQEISRDPAMIRWLDGNANIKGRPNENYARELFELFTLGVGNYTEMDIKEAARAFTGWHERNGEFHFVAHAHDAGEKRVLGTAGPLDGDDVTRIAIAQPACARFIAIKLVREFLLPEPEEALISDLADHLRATDFDIRSAVRRILTSEAMFAPATYRARIKSPVEFVIGLARSLGLEPAGSAMADATSQMGQRLFEPPTVAGWEGHRAWLNSTSMLVRLNAAIIASREAAPRFSAADELIDHCAKVTLDGEVPSALHARLESAAHEDNGAAKVLELLLTAPEYQLA